jgi:large subunit ribosomal protein L17
MRHGDKIKNLSRTAAHRKALLNNLTCQLIQHKRIITTLAKAKSLRIFAEPIITRSKEDTMHNRRVVFSYLQDKEAIKELFGVISDKVADRPGGYTRIIKLPRRAGDASDMAMIELVDFNELYGKSADAAAAKKTRRSRRSASGAKKQTATATEAAVDTTGVFVDPNADVPEVVAETAPVTEVAEAAIASNKEVVADAPATESTEETTETKESDNTEATA